MYLSPCSLCVILDSLLIMTHTFSLWLCVFFVQEYATLIPHDKLVMQALLTKFSHPGYKLDNLTLSKSCALPYESPCYLHLYSPCH